MALVTTRASATEWVKFKGGLRLRGHIEDQFEIQTSFSQAAGNIQDGKNISVAYLSYVKLLIASTFLF